MRIAVGLASAGRPETLQTNLKRLASQSRPPDCIFVGIADERDLADAQAARALGAKILMGVRGLTRQRNAIVAACGDCDLLAFFDDDFVASDDYLAEAEALFTARPDVVLATGEVLADGKLDAGLTFADADAVLAKHARAHGPAPRAVYNAYGCNMVLSLAPVQAHRLRFDERLPLYGWLEDVDFSRQLASYGAVVHAPALAGVHLGVKRGRQSGRRLGYSQVANPVYLALKRTIRGEMALWLMCRNIGKNLTRSLRPEPFVDRRGRLAGNALALRDLLTLRLDPERVMDL